MARNAAGATSFRGLHSVHFAAVVSLVCFMASQDKYLVCGSFPGGEPQQPQQLQRQQQQQQLKRQQQQQRQQQQHPQHPLHDQHQHSPQRQHDLEARRHPSPSASSTQKVKQIGGSEEQTIQRTAAEERETLHEVGRELDDEEEEFAREEFAEYDANGDGLLDAFEIRTTHTEIRSDELHHFFRAVDTNNDGLISLEEYRSFLQTSS